MKYLLPAHEKINGIGVKRLFTLTPKYFNLRVVPYGILSYTTINNSQPDLVHGHDWDTSIYSLLRKKFKQNVPFFLHSHGNNIRWTKNKAYQTILKKVGIWRRITENYTNFKSRIVWERMAHRNADFIFTDCHALKNEVVEDFKVPPEKVHVVYNGIDTQKFKPITSSVRKDLGISDDSILLFHPQADARKGIDVTLKAFSLLEKQYKNVFLLILGRTKEYYRLRRYHAFRSLGL